MRDRLNNEVQNKFLTLQPKEDSIVECWKEIKLNIIDVSESCLGCENPQKKNWMNEDTWNEIEKRKQLKQKINQSRTRQQKVNAQQNTMPLINW